MRIRRTPRAAAALLAAAALAGLTAFLAPAAVADDPSGATPTTPDASASASAGSSPSDAAPTEAGTDFRTATPVEQGQQATASASAGDYLYWSFPADTGQNVTVKATVTFPSGAVRHGASTWQVDVYDGLRRRQACRYGTQTRTAAPDATTVDLACTLRTVRAWAEPWSNDPLRGAYYVRLAVVDLPQTDLGLPVQAAVTATAHGTAGEQAVDGHVTPLVTGNGPELKPDGGWAGTWWSPRWLWTGGGGLLAVLAALGAHRLARGPVLPFRPRYSPEPTRPREPAGYSG
ncbi:hypothetical protein [Actinacidiphila rubida]|uniref:Secreted protein n=1 Tax=Actinacidiphila rubida TaxID=310780 RepID=A0A1H8UCH1_9ACTN|nr:hypothetical protein [Actinacidiphila rubida]SEP00919.1 hypothetical protein SAMN05216267_10698 [Actinacidiphila rubida]